MAVPEVILLKFFILKILFKEFSFIFVPGYKFAFTGLKLYNIPLKNFYRLFSGVYFIKGNIIIEIKGFFYLKKLKGNINFNNPGKSRKKDFINKSAGFPSEYNKGNRLIALLSNYVGFIKPNNN